MKIEFKQVIPIPLKNNYASNNDVWNRELSFTSPGYYLMRAPSGAGKSTFISMLAGIRSDYEGEILADGKALKTFSLKEWSTLRASGFAAVYQDLRLFHNLTALENILITPQQPKLNNGEIAEMARELGIENKMNSICGNLSLGQQQRLAIIRALSNPFQFLLLDEPFSHLDEANIRLASALIERKCRQYNAGLILTTLNEPYFFEYLKEFTL